MLRPRTITTFSKLCKVLENESSSEVLQLLPQVFQRNSGRCMAATLGWNYQMSQVSSAVLPFNRSFSAIAERKEQGTSSSGKETVDSLELTEEKINALTDKIPQRPMGVVEGTSYSLVILYAIGALVFVLWQFITNFILEPTAMQCFNHTLNRLKTDPRITVRLGNSDEIRAWGSNSQSRVARQQVPHQIFKDANGIEHVRLQFIMRGPSGTGQVHADMYKDAAGQWQYTYLLMDVYSGTSQTPSRVHIVSPR
ncbi:hypothetical protein CEUSTIGMA_g12144.t1 [Chlamydomonas eustigma]|uniref:Mitochondrial import inner membrane translocase subunit Tim21 n=1 Tax=Chlamydomonas eustigma TaxID=1157962 RepID=A0A250XP70_9CHLO|nr:hypothetical protein CEUSTIGMA_g12144.t1 [Chlamydomonas eustigma]|eukprot:GAX84722.1 hypothetical protein CEUSTIGMA_g12144.t1 [Chlamydomonas eustigma]